MTRTVSVALVAGLLIGAASAGAQSGAMAGSGGQPEFALASAASLRDSQDLFDFCTSSKNQGRCALSVYDVSNDRMAHLFPDRPQVLASTSKILFLLAYAQAVVSGAIDPADTLSRDEWARYLTLDGFALKTSWEDLGSPTTVTWGELARMMILHSDNATPDHLYAILGTKRLKNARKFFKGFHDMPLPISAMFGLWSNGTGVGGTASRVADAYGSMGTAGYRGEAGSLFKGLGNPGPLATYRESLCVTPPWESAGPCNPPQPQGTPDERKFMTRNHFTRSTTRTYMKLMAALLAGNVMKQSERDVVIPILETWLDEFPTLSPTFSRYGLKGGSLAIPGALDVLTWAHYMRASGNDYVVVVFLQGLSDAKDPVDASDVNSFAQHFAIFPAFREAVLEAFAADDERTEIVPEIIKLKAPKRREAGRAVAKVKVRAENASPNKSKGFVVRMYLSNDNQLGAGDTLLAVKNMPALKGYKGKNATLKGSSASFAGKYLIVTVDDEGDLDEQDVDNNVVWQRVG